MSDLAEEIALEAVKLKVSAITCPKCRWTIYSRARHDFVKCLCGAVAIDGGFDYMKLSFDTGMTPPKPFEYLVDATKKELYDDYNRQGRKFGRVPPPGADGAGRPGVGGALSSDSEPVPPSRKNSGNGRTPHSADRPRRKTAPKAKVPAKRRTGSKRPVSLRKRKEV